MDKIIVKGARENNLKNVNIELPKNKLIVMTGVSVSIKPKKYSFSVSSINNPAIKFSVPWYLIKVNFCKSSFFKTLL